jgi:hypothetical protein
MNIQSTVIERLPFVFFVIFVAKSAVAGLP